MVKICIGFKEASGPLKFINFRVHNKMFCKHMFHYMQTSLVDHTEEMIVSYMRSIKCPVLVIT